MTCENFKLVAYCHSKLWVTKVIKLDVCGNLVFSNLVKILVSPGILFPHQPCNAEWQGCHTGAHSYTVSICRLICDCSQNADQRIVKLDP